MSADRAAERAIVTAPRGYEHPGYARSLDEFGTPRELARCGGWILERPVPGGGADVDAIGGYPIFRCRDWSALADDVRALDGDIVSLSLVPDLFADFDETRLRECFRDVVIPFKEHFVIDMQRPLDRIVSRHHRKYARKALDSMHVDVLARPREFLDDWVVLHRNLIARYDISGIRAFSRLAFARQLELPGMVVLRATLAGETLGAQLWMQHDDVAYGHVLAFSQRGYELGAPYALYWSSLAHFMGRVQWCSIGGVAGIGDGGSEGLSQFKRGWATGRRTAWFCGRICDPDRYAALVRDSGRPPGRFFPGYRSTF